MNVAAVPPDAGAALLESIRGLLGAQLLLVVSWPSGELARVHGASPPSSSVRAIRLPRALAGRGDGLHFERPVRAEWFLTSTLRVECALAHPEALLVVATAPTLEERLPGAGLLAVWGAGAEARGDLETAVVGLRPVLEATVRAFLTVEAEREARARLTALLGAVPEGIVLTDEGAGTALVNDAAAALIGVPAGVVLAAELSEGMRALHARCAEPARLAEEGRALFQSPGASRTEWAWDVVVPAPRMLRVTTVPVRACSHRGRLWAFRDVTQLVEQQRALRALAERDALTGLLNRRGFEHAVAAARSRDARAGRCPVLLTIDLDGFKPINDRFGHAVGDEALRGVARMLQDVVRGTDAVGRLGGDEFALYLADIETRANLAPVLGRLARVRDTHNAAGAAQGRPYRIDWSVGTAFEEPGDDLAAMLARADAAMYAQKRRLVATDRSTHASAAEAEEPLALGV